MNDNHPRNTDYIRNCILNSLEGMANLLYNLPDDLDHLDKLDLLQIQMSAERLESRLSQTLSHLSRLTGRRYK